jgi:YD repeat-containing protein
MSLKKLAIHVQTLNELTERRRVNTFFKHQNTDLTKGLQKAFVNTSIGNLNFERRDMVVIDKSPIRFTRVYDSSRTDEADFGKGWYLASSDNNKLIDQNNQLQKLTTPNGHFVNIERNNKGFISLITDNNRSVSYKYKKDQLTTVTDMGGKNWQYNYSGKGLLTKVTDPQGYKAAIFKYNNQGKVTYSNIRGVKHDYAYKDGYIVVTNQTATKFSYDQGKVKTLSHIKDDGTIEQFTLNYTEQGQLSELLSGKILVQYFTYSETGRPLTITGDGPTRTYTYADNGNLLSQQNGEILRTFSYTADGLLQTLTQGSQTTQFEYNKTGKLSQVTFPDKSFHQYDYNELGFRKQTIRKSGTSISYDYDSLGNFRGAVDVNEQGQTKHTEISLDKPSNSFMLPPEF